MQEQSAGMLVMSMILYMVLLLLVSSVVQLSFNNVIPYITQNSMKVPKINLVQSLSLVVLMSTLVKTSCICANNGQLQ